MLRHVARTCMDVAPSLMKRLLSARAEIILWAAMAANSVQNALRSVSRPSAIHSKNVCTVNATSSMEPPANAGPGGE